MIRVFCAFSWADDELLETLTPYMIGKKPNTYTYTKQLAEGLLADEGKDLPVVMVRPSIVTAAMNEPLPVNKSPSNEIGFITYLTKPFRL